MMRDVERRRGHLRNIGLRHPAGEAWMDSEDASIFIAEVLLSFSPIPEL
jgi:hypothetical protein